MSRLLVIGCGALAAELAALKRANSWDQIDIQCLDAALHNRPERIAARLESLLADQCGNYDRFFIAYADCGTGGGVDEVARKFGAARLPGAHCYEFYASSAVFHALSDAEPGTFYLTDFLAKHFDRLVVADLKLDKYPELEPQLFGHYRKVVYLAQVHDDTLRASATRAAERLGLPLEIIETGYGQLASSLQEQVVRMIP